ncbi:hypothetical protein T4D_3763 [Trichinella pseudospiralis]|uniref:Uncharacterized protein n=1 Tax=Trichinella pseudospiralis TaxID=6337 RepID=A0A0V1FWH3_TRIPS|nr:hypothetical protein T4D_3763 [Trichinella pseudospiralis]
MGVTHATRKESSMLAIVRNASREEYPHFIATYTSPGALIALPEQRASEIQRPGARLVERIFVILDHQKDYGRCRWLACEKTHVLIFTSFDCVVVVFLYYRECHRRSSKQIERSTRIAVTEGQS